MNVVTVHLSNELHDEIEAIARQKGISINALLIETTKALVSAYHAEKRFQERAARGAGREAEALALLDRI